MKHLKKFNESDGQEIDKELLDMIFVNFLDKGIQTTMDHNRVYRLKTNYEGIDSINSLKSYSTLLINDSLELEECLSKVKIEYPDISHMLTMSGQNIILEIYIDKDNYEEDDDWEEDEEDDRFTTWNRLHRDTWGGEEDEDEDEDYPDL